ncbi:MAG: hypothetical protein BAJALOKI3v1_480004 [Promethearchaeota archaeon]|jgi:hypothetical protein|nr:MAG: hypothetical protein BAJALOKI3v1_480004 [Candidatus Lokiarchaeota archaeon]
MSEKKKKLRGFAKVISQQLEPLNDNEEFKKKFKDTNLKILLNAVDGRYAALIKIKEGTVEVDGIKNNEKENLTKEALGWDGRLATTTNLFFKIATGELSTISMIGKIITRKIKIKGISKVLALTEIFALL